MVDRARLGRAGAIRVGTSGWQYGDWRDAFYPPGVPKLRWFEYYAARFSTVEINATFYRLPRTSTVEAWRSRAPRGFRFAVKGSRYLTHNLKLNDPAGPVATITGRMRPLGGVHGIWLWQLPPNLHRDAERLERFLQHLPARPRHAVEFRHRSWYDDDIAELLRRHDVAWVWLSDGFMPDDHPVTTDQVYLRFHGLGDRKDRRYRWDYTIEELEPWVERLRDAAGAGADCWVYFNNDYGANAPRNARVLIELLGSLAAPWPPASDLPVT